MSHRLIIMSKIYNLIVCILFRLPGSDFYWLDAHVPLVGDVAAFLELLCLSTS